MAPSTTAAQLAFLAIILATGCHGEKHQAESEPNKELPTMTDPNTGRDAPIGSSEARAALLELVRQRGAEELPVFQQQATVLANKPIEQVGPSRFRIGEWSIRTDTSTFSVWFSNPHVVLGYKGKFERDKQGQWVAAITQWTKGDVDPP